MSEPSTLSRQQRRFAAREQAKHRAKATSHDCATERVAIAENVEIYFDNPSEQHRLHLLFGELRCKACSVCDERAAKGIAPSPLDPETFALMPGHWRDKVSLARLMECAHVQRGMEILARYLPTRTIHGTMMHVNVDRPVESGDSTTLEMLGWVCGREKWIVELAPFYESDEAEERAAAWRARTGVIPSLA